MTVNTKKSSDNILEDVIDTVGDEVGVDGLKVLRDIMRQAVAQKKSTNPIIDTPQANPQPVRDDLEKYVDFLRELTDPTNPGRVFTWDEANLKLKGAWMGILNYINVNRKPWVIDEQLDNIFDLIALAMDGEGELNVGALRREIEHVISEVKNVV